jgi:hypothetical protein
MGGVGDHHTVPIYNLNRKFVKRQVIASDEFSLLRMDWLYVERE